LDIESFPDITPGCSNIVSPRQPTGSLSDTHQELSHLTITDCLMLVEQGSLVTDPELHISREILKGMPDCQLKINRLGE